MEKKVKYESGNLVYEFDGQLSSLKNQRTFIPLFHVIAEKFIENIINQRQEYGISAINTVKNKYSSQGTFYDPSKVSYWSRKLPGGTLSGSSGCGLYRIGLLGEIQCKIDGKSISITLGTANMEESGDFVFSMYRDINFFGDSTLVDKMYNSFKEFIRQNDFQTWWVIAADELYQFERSQDLELDTEISDFYIWKRRPVVCSSRFFKQTDPFKPQSLWLNILDTIVSFFVFIILPVLIFLVITTFLLWWIPVLIITHNAWFWWGIAWTIIAGLTIFILTFQDCD